MRTRLTSILLMALFAMLFACKKSEITPTVITVEEVTMSPTATSLVVGGTTRLTAAVTPANAISITVDWSSDNEDVAIVDADGVVTAVAVGTATITATTKNGGKRATCLITVTDRKAPVQSVAMNKKTTTMMVSKTETLSLIFKPTGATNKTTIWHSSDEGVAKVVDGVVTAVAVGTATITATTEDGGHKATCVVTTSSLEVSVTGVTLTEKTKALQVGGEHTLLAEITPSEATNQNLTWASDNQDVAIVDGNGKVTALNAGKATITAISNDDDTKSATCTVTVTDKAVSVESVSLDKTTAEIEEGETLQLVATVAPAGATDKTLKWTSSDNEDVATVVDGVVTAKTIGTATITATTADGTKSATCAVTVVAWVDHVVIGDLKWAKGSLVADGTDDCKIGKSKDGGLYFQFGSLVGWSGGANGDGTGTGTPALALQVKPAAYTSSTEWATTGYYTGGTTIIKGYALPSTDDPTTGIGDPCRYYLGDPWRTPTATQYSTLGDAGEGSWVTSPANGCWFGPNPGNASSSVFFPASGYRNASEGAFNSVGTGGRFWSSSHHTATNGYELYFKSGYVNLQSLTLRLFGFPARCVSPK